MTRKRFCKLVMSRGYDRDYDQRKDQWAKYWEEKEKGADVENETK